MSIGQETNNYTLAAVAGDSPITITQEMGITAVSIIGTSATASNVIATPQNPTQAIGNLPPARAISIPQDRIITFSAPSGKHLDQIVITIPGGGTVDFIINQ